MGCSASSATPKWAHTRRAARGLPRDQCNTADTAGQYCLGSRSRPRAVSALPPCACATELVLGAIATRALDAKLDAKAGAHEKAEQCLEREAR